MLEKNIYDVLYNKYAKDKIPSQDVLNILSDIQELKKNKER